MAADDDIERAERDFEGGGQSSGVPAQGKLADGPLEPLGRQGLRHWRESTVTKPGLDDRGDVFFAAVEMTRMPMVLTDPRQPDNPVVFANKAFLDLTGYEEDEVLGRNCRFLQGTHTDRETVRQLREAVAAREAISIEVLNYRRDGSAFWNAVFIGPVYDADGELLYFFASQLDVTRRRESEQAFRQAQKMEAIGQLTAGLAHDFNNLLHVVSGCLERLGAKVELGDGRRFLETAMAATDRGAKLTRQLLAFARRSRLEPRSCDLTALVAEVADLLDTTVGPKVDLRLDLRRRLPRVNIDPNHFEMALLNVVINARDAMPEGGEIVVSTGFKHLNGDAAAHRLDPGDYVVLSVKDTGVGMPEHVRARATEPFFTTKPTGQGTGLGLAMALGFVQQSGGRLEIDSAPGQGCCINMLFPVVPAFDEAPDTPSERKAEGGMEGRKVLVVDDSPEIADLAQDALSAAGYKVVTASSGEEALDVFRSALEVEPFGLVFSDVVMPGGMNGIVLAQEIRRLAPMVPILLTTGYNDELALQGPHAEAMDVIGKPYRRAELIDRVGAALQTGVRTRPSRMPSDFGAAEA